MDLTAIGHRTLPFAGPYGDRQAEAIAGALAPLRPGRLIDAGCGEAELLLRLVDRLGATTTGLGIDRSDVLVARGRAKAEARGLAERVTFRVGDATVLPEPHGFDVALCVGATHIWDGLARAVEALVGAVVPGGAIVVGEGFWQRPPTPEALAGLGASPDEYRSLEATRAVLTEVGATILAESLTTQPEWDGYEGAWVANVRAHAERTDDDRLRRVADDHRHGYERGYRGVLGFALWVARLPAS